MNYLAHAVCAGPDPDWTVGAFLGDHVRGSGWRRYPAAVAASILLHRRLDSHLDGRPEMREARAAFGPDRRYAGILLDMGFDHLLARDWARRSPLDLPLEDFAAHCHRSLGAATASLPPSLQRFEAHARRARLLQNYGTEEVLDQALRGLGSRLSRPGPLDRGFAALRPRMAAVEAAFDALWPRLLDHAGRERARLSAALP